MILTDKTQCMVIPPHPIASKFKADRSPSGLYNELRDCSKTFLENKITQEHLRMKTSEKGLTIADGTLLAETQAAGHGRKGKESWVPDT